MIRIGGVRQKRNIRRSKSSIFNHQSTVLGDVQGQATDATGERNEEERVFDLWVLLIRHAVAARLNGLVEVLLGFLCEHGAEERELPFVGHTEVFGETILLVECDELIDEFPIGRPYRLAHLPIDVVVTWHRESVQCG